jgi:hypothetical protein
MKEQSGKPGAGTYNATADMKRSSPRYGFGSSKRPDIGYRKDNSPGPGAYRLPSQISNVPKFCGLKVDEAFITV